MNKKFWIALNVIVLIGLIAGLLGSIAYFNHEIGKIQMFIWDFTGHLID